MSSFQNGMLKHVLKWPYGNHEYLLYYTLQGMEHNATWDVFSNNTRKNTENAKNNDIVYNDDENVFMDCLHSR